MPTADELSNTPTTDELAAAMTATGAAPVGALRARRYHPGVHRADLLRTHGTGHPPVGAIRV
ncbi:hypothetical protein [Streptomyces sp. NPDC046685]|uniref:hypothetical protein n=1 Tax=Streptomyces sp. NPDC046685 TaxID=3157202 RepID=UPI0034003373